MKKLLIPLFALAIGFCASAKEVTDEITYSALGLSGSNSNYTLRPFTGQSGAQYQLNNGYNDNSCFIINNSTGFIITTKSPGTVKSIKIEIANSANLTVFASNTAYAALSGSVSKAAVAEMLGTAVKTGVKTDYTFDSDYSYVAFQGSASLQITKLSITWDVDDSTPGTPDTPGTDDPVTLTNVLKDLSVGDNVTATGVVTAQNTRGFILTDEGGSILYYNPAVNISDYPIGTAVEISGTVSQYNFGLQLAEQSTIKKVGTYDYTYPSPLVYTANMVDEACASTENFAPVYVSLTGTLSISGNYYNILIDGASAQGSIYYVIDSIKSQMENGKTYKFEGYFTSVSTSNSNGQKFFNIIVTKAIDEQGSGNDPGTPDNPDLSAWTVAQALTKMKDGFEGDAIVKGVISEIQEISTQYGNATYFIKDALTDEESLEVYRGYGLNGDKFTSSDQLAVGATVEVSGELVNYNGTGTYEFTSGSKILSYTPPSGDVPSNPEAPSLNVNEALEEIERGFQGYAYVEGYIISIKEVSTQYGNATFTIADNMTYTEGLTVFRTKYLDGAAFTSANQIAVGGKVKIYGYLTIYDSNPEVTSCKLIEYEAPEGGNPETPGTPGDEGGVEKVIFSESFGESLGAFTTSGELPEGLTYVWSWGGANYGAKASAYVSGTRYDVANWLVSPVIDLTNYTEVYINFENALNYLNGNPATDFVGVYVSAAGSTPSETGWTNLSDKVTFGSGSDWTFVNSGNVAVAGFDGKKVQFGFLYKSTSTDSPTWEVKGFKVSGTTVGSGSVETIGSELNGPAVYYNLQGMKVKNPVKGQIYIVNGKKVVLK